MTRFLVNAELTLLLGPFWRQKKHLAHFVKNEFLGLKHSQETRLEIDVTFLFVHVSCSRRALEPSSAEIKTQR